MMTKRSIMSKNKKISKDSLLKGKGQKLYKHAKELIPGGTQLLSKRPEMFAPNLWPSYYSKAKGSKVWDLDNNKFCLPHQNASQNLFKNISRIGFHENKNIK